MNLSNAKLVNYVRDFISNKLKLNKDKSEVLVISSSYRPPPPLSSVDICDETVFCSPSARNIGVTFDQSLCMVPHVNAVCQSYFFHLLILVSYANILLTTLQRSLFMSSYFLSFIIVILYCMACHPILFGSFNMFKILPLALSTSVQDSAILLQS